MLSTSSCWLEQHVTSLAYVLLALRTVLLPPPLVGWWWWMDDGRWTVDGGRWTVGSSGYVDRA